jgi:hypothetical protein
MVSFSFQEKPFPYNFAQYKRWCEGDISIIKSLTNVCGNLCRGENTYINQKNMSQNYPEVRYAVYLVEDKGFPKNYIIYENFRLSLQVINQLIWGKGPRAKGAKIIKEIFSSLFLENIDTLCELNEERFEQIKKVCKETHVDLCAINPESREVHLCEIKRYDFGGKTNEKFSLHQQLLLGFVRYAVESLGREAFVEKKYKVITELIAFVPESDLSKFSPKHYRIDFVDKR